MYIRFQQALVKLPEGGFIGFPFENGMFLRDVNLMTA